MKPGFLALALLALTGCASFTEAAKRHPYVTGFVITSLALSGAHALRSDGGREPEVSSPLVACEPAERCQ